MPSQTELFLDDQMIEVSAGVKRRLRLPNYHRLNPVLCPELWHEGNLVSPRAVLYDREEKLFKMWYLTGSLARQDLRVGEHELYTAYAVSPDGVRWERPPLGVFEFGGRRDHNVVFCSDRPNQCNPAAGRKAWIDSVVAHPRPKDETEKYVALCFDQGKRGCYLARSADGLRWVREKEPFWRTPVDAANWGDDNIHCMIYDAEIRRWVVYRRLIPQESARFFAAPGDETRPPVDRYVRVIGRAESPDLATWEGHRIILAPDGDDPPDAEFYGLSCYRYEGVCAGFLWVYHMAPEVERIDAQLVASRDGVHFTRCCRRETFLRGGLPGAYNYGLTVAYQPQPIVLNDMVYLFGTGGNYAHTGKDLRQPFSRQTAWLATLPRDRFASFETGGPPPCQLVTKPFVVAQPNLYLNAATWGQGAIRVEALDRDWTPLAGFTDAEAAPIRGDSLAHPLRWNRHPNASALVGREVRLKFRMADSRIHALIQDSDARNPAPPPDAGPGEARAVLPEN
ncbi:MAG TPA: hypothetical protein P5137_09040 [Candidatus Brocadiia bacterium]|nr:hypothetical protein [Candidatus Brocadiia bacterium]